MPVEPFALTTQLSQSPAEDYDAIHASAMETAQGRWFLREFARRNRNADTELLLAAIQRIELAVSAQAAAAATDRLPDGAPVQSAPPLPAARLSYGEAAPFTHQLHELRDAILLTKASLPEVGTGHASQSDFARIAKGISVVAARMRWIAEQVPEAQNRAIVTVHDDLDKLTDAAAMVADLLAEIELRLGSLIDAAQAIVDAEAQAQALVTEAVFGAPARAPDGTAPAEAAAAPAEAQTVAEAVEEDMRWLESLAPTIVRHSEDAPAKSASHFDFALEPHVPTALPNPAWREHEPAASAPTAEIAAEIAQAAPVQFDLEPEPLAPAAPEPAAQEPVTQEPVAQAENAPAEPAEIADVAAAEMRALEAAMPMIAAAEMIAAETIAVEEAEWPPRVEAVLQPDQLLAMIQQAIEQTIQQTIQETVQETIQDIQGTIQEAIVDTIGGRAVAAEPQVPVTHIVAPAALDDEPRDDPAAFDFDPFSHALQDGPHIEHPAAYADQPEAIAPPPAIPTLQLVPPPPANDTGAHAAPPSPPHAPTPPLPPHRPRQSSDALAPIRALSDEERIALFS